ncbi:ComF family protein [Brevibacterium luteolum]|uniref:ComF family protein n=1 Tax=Brevibacterium luteolum TaxID=199591 RepID=UPI0021AFA38F|nr:phosphoribosyltransferase family protein [Brevibacterium luteolum]MCT1828902.1 ComF family protein [Brevibacterium luteolum]
MGAPRARGPVTAWAAAAADELAELVIPRACVGCGADTVSVCGHCLTGMATETITALPRYGTAAVTAAGSYTGVLRAALVAFKESGRKDLAPLLGLQLARAIITCLQEIPTPGGLVLLVPVPATPKARRARDGNHVAQLCAAAAQLLAADRLRVHTAELLTVRRHRDQVGFGARSRRRNVRGSHALDTRLTPRARHAVSQTTTVLVDDICTTGATLAESARALRAGGILPCGTAVIALAPGSGSLERRHGM